MLQDTLFLLTCFICMYVCMYVCMDGCVYVCIHMYVCIVEFSFPFDQFIDLRYQYTFNKYIELCNKCNELGYHNRITFLIIGSLSLVHNKFVNGLKVIGLTTPNAKAIAKYVSVSAQIGLHLCWSCRMRK